VTGAELKIGSRGSALAMAQARLVSTALSNRGHPNGIVVITTEGDRRAPDTAWGEGAFVAAIEHALLDRRVDIAVHSAKDIPTEEDARLRIAAYLPRADARDALVVREGVKDRRFDDLPSGSRIGTDSPRRTGFLRARRPDLLFHPLHGNVDTRLRRLESGETDALVLACAGLDRLGMSGRIDERLGVEIVPPAPGQGAIAVQVRADEEPALAAGSSLDDRPTRLAVEAERSFLRASGGGCRAPIGAFATIAGNALDLLGGHAAPDGSRVDIGRRQGEIDDGPELGRRLAAELDRARRASASPTAFGAPAPRVLVTRPGTQAGALLSALRGEGLDPVLVPVIEIQFSQVAGAVANAAEVLHSYRWVVITSPNGVRALFRAREQVPIGFGSTAWAAIGEATRNALEREGVESAFTPSEPNAASLAADLPVDHGDHVLVLRGDLAGEMLASVLRARGAVVDDVIAYRTREAPIGSRRLLRAAVDGGPFAAVVFTSGSTVRGLRSLAQDESIDVTGIPAFCIGAETAETARLAGFRVVAVSPTPGAAAVARTVAVALARQFQQIS
jgi:hydroxymethylbilane synthase